MTEKEQQPYAVVWFPEETKGGKKLFDIVPRSWLVGMLNNKWNRYYPPNDHADVEKLVREEVMPDSNWKKYPVEIIKRAGDYEQGLRRLDRAYANNLDVESTEVESTEAEGTETDGTEVEVAEVEGSESQSPNANQEDDECYEIGSKKKKRDKRASAVAVRTGIRHTARPIGPDVWEQMEQMEARLTKVIKGAKQSFLYDFNKKVEELKSTVIINHTPGVGSTFKNLKETLGVQLPFKEDEAFKDFVKSVKEDNEKDAALRAVMVELAKGENDAKGAVRKILGGIMAKSVQELYSAAGRAGANGKTKQSFSATLVYECMRNVIVDLLPEKTTQAAILSATSRYLSGAGDREGGKKARDARKTVVET